jgi:hypothetical protein
MTSSTMTTEAQDAATADTQSTPIAEYGMLADCNSAAHVSRAGSVDWLCLPRYDSPAIFARLLGPDAGHWSIRPAGEFRGEPQPRASAGALGHAAVEFANSSDSVALTYDGLPL